MSWSESVDQALCFGWVDGVRKSIDIEAYTIRFTPRKKSSIWSAVNIEKVERLIKTNQMKDAGLIAFSFRKESRCKIYSYEKALGILAGEFETHFKQNKIAWEFFEKQAPSYKKKL